MIVLRTPKGWTCPRELDGHRLEDSWRAHQVPITDVVSNPGHLELLETWMRSYRPAELFDKKGRLISELRELAPTGARRISANPHANGGQLRKPRPSPHCASRYTVASRFRCYSCEYGYIVRGLRTVCCRPAPTS